MNYYALSDKAIDAELGSRFKALRLRRNITQSELAASTVLSLNSIKSLELGRGKLSTIIAVLRELGELDQLENLIPKMMISPLQLAKLKGKVRLRAAGDHSKDVKKKDTKW